MKHVRVLLAEDLALIRHGIRSVLQLADDMEIVGEADTVDPVGQSLELYRGLKRYGVDTELVLYPREPHGFHEEKHLVDRLNRILAWYDKYLKGDSGSHVNAE